MRQAKRDQPWLPGASRHVVLALCAAAFAKGKEPFLYGRGLSHPLNSAGP